MYHIEDGVCYVSANANNLFILWAKNICALKGYKLVFFFDEVF
jgi:hypothetical protein